MCGDRAMTKRRLFALLFLALPGATNAQSFGGSFETGGGVQTQPAPPVTGGSFGADTSGGSGGFGGSFESGSGSQPAVTSPAPGSGPAVSSPGGGDFSGGSFDTVQPGPAVPQPQPQPPQNTVAPQPTQPTQPGPTTQGIRLDPQILAFESRDFGVPPTAQLRNGQLHGATPTAIPGGQLVSTESLANALNQGMQILLIDVLGGNYSLPGAYVAPGLAQPGSFNDRTQQQAAQWLQQVTGGNPGVPIVVFCSDPQCWLSYNAALRTINAGYSQVYWYRGGVQAWQMGGLPMLPAGW